MMASSASDEGLEQLLAVLGGLVDEVGRDLLDRVVLALLGLAAPGERTHADQVDDAEEVALVADRELEDERDGAEAVDDHVDAAEEVGAGAVELVDEADAGNAVLVGLAPHGLGLGLDARDAVEHRDGAVEDAQRALDLDGEVDVAGGVDDVDRGGLSTQQVVAADVMVMPRSCSCSIQSIVAAPSWTSPIL